MVDKNRAGWYYDNYLKKLRLWVWVVVYLVSLLVFVVGVFIGVYNIGVRVDRQGCQAYGAQTARETAFVNTGWLDWECFTKVEGQWVLRDNIRVTTRILP